MEIIERIRAALARHLDTAVQVVTRQEWDDANGPEGRPTRLVRPLSPFRSIEGTGAFVSAVVSAQPFADVPGSHIVRYDPDDYPDVMNIDSHDWILDLPADPAWPRVLAITGLADTPDLLTLVRQHVFGVPTFRPDHHNPTVPGDIAGATPKDE
jgi:hypothetical protein